MIKQFVAAALLMVCGCAKFPATSTSQATKLIFTMTVDGQLKSNFVYIVAMRFSPVLNPTDGGPIPVVAPPWGNGFVAGNATHYMRWDPIFQSPAYILYKFQDVDLNNSTQLGAPLNFDDVQAGGKTLSFTIDLNQLGLSPADIANLRSVQLNFLTMDRVPQGTDPIVKNFDALGNSLLPSGINQFITIPLNTSRTYDNAFFNELEPKGDVPDPDLDIVNFSVQVQLP